MSPDLQYTLTISDPALRRHMLRRFESAELCEVIQENLREDLREELQDEVIRRGDDGWQLRTQRVEDAPQSRNVTPPPMVPGWTKPE